MTPKEQEVLDAIKSYYDEHGFFPRQADLLETLEMKRSNLSLHCNHLEEKGYIKMIEYPEEKKKVKIIVNKPQRLVLLDKK